MLIVIVTLKILRVSFNSNFYTLHRKKVTLSLPIFPGDTRSGSVTPRPGSLWPGVTEPDLEWPGKIEKRKGKFLLLKSVRLKMKLTLIFLFCFRWHSIRWAVSKTFVTEVTKSCEHGEWYFHSFPRHKQLSCFYSHSRNGQGKYRYIEGTIEGPGEMCKIKVIVI